MAFMWHEKMNKLIHILLTVFALLSFGMSAMAEEITLFDSEGEPIAYIDTEDEDLTIFMWIGTPVAYLEQREDGFSIYGFNGKHLGWYSGGLVRDHEGFVVGFIEGATWVFTKFEPIKGFKKHKPFKDFKELEPYKPFDRSQFATEPLSLFLLQGKK